MEELDELLRQLELDNCVNVTVHGLPVTATEVLRQLSRIFQDPAGQGATRAYRAATALCCRSCLLMSAMRESLQDPDARIEHILIPATAAGESLLFEACAPLQVLGLAIDYLQKTNAYINETMVRIACQLCDKLAKAYTQEVKRVLDSPGGPKRAFSSLDSISSAETHTLRLLHRLHKDCPEAASVLCRVGDQKIAALAQLAEALREARFRSHMQKVTLTISKPMTTAVQGLVQVLSNPDCGVLRDEARTVLLGIRSLIALPIFEHCPGLDASLVFARLEHEFKNRASFQALGLKSTSEDLEKFKKQTQLLRSAAITSALSPSVTVKRLGKEGNDGWLQRPLRECGSEAGAMQQVPSVAGSWTLCSFSSNWTYDHADQS